MSLSTTAKDAIRIVSTAGLGKDVIDLLTQKVTLLDEKLVESSLSLEQARLKISELIAENKELRKQSNGSRSDVTALPDGFNETTNKIVELMFQLAQEVSKEEVSSRLGLELGIIQFHFDLLIDAKFVHQSRGAFARLSGGHDPAEYSLQAGGRAYAMRLKQQS